MFVRLLLLLLLALNLGAGAWLLFGHARVAPLPPATAPGVPELRLWTGTATAARPADAPSSPPTVASPVAAAASQMSPEACTTLGPFMTTIDMRTAMQTLSPHVVRIQYREEQLSRSHGYWVYLPAAATREAALDEARRLAARDIHDYYVVTAGDTQNTISLGLFNDEANANKRLAMVTKAGFPARLEQRIETEPAYWLDYSVPAGTAFEWQAWLPGRSDLHTQPIDCF
ncbi:MAG TPA: SPOR domain-containing protein [Rhodanobacteraceae bacterium]|nr:SPOR domain-containing protein [Rhodanobacteraceae bacterium]